MDTVEEIISAGCCLRAITTQFGLNQNPSIYSLSVVRDKDQIFEIGEQQRWGIRSPYHIQIGALDQWGIVQGWDEDVINTGGSGVFNIRIADFRMAMETPQIYLGAPDGELFFNQNICPIPAPTLNDEEFGIEYYKIRTAVQSKIFEFGDIRFYLDLSEIYTPSRYLNGEAIPYRMNLATLSLIEFIQQIAEDYCFDWYVETSLGSFGAYDNIYKVKIKVLNRNNNIIDMNALKNLHTNKVVQMSTGHEIRDEVTRTVLMGAVKQTLVKYPGSKWSQFWGVSDNGDIYTQPTIRIPNNAGLVTTKTLSVEQLQNILNGETTGYTELELDLIKAYADSFFGKQFYMQLDASQLDSDNKSWLDVAEAGWWEENTQPEYIPYSDLTKFSTEDGRWGHFVRLTPPSQFGGTWDSSISTSDAFIDTGYNRFILKAELNRIDLSRNVIDGNPIPIGSIMVLTLSNQLMINKLINGIASRYIVYSNPFIDTYCAISDKRQSYGPWTSDELIPLQARLPGRTRLLVDESLAPWTFGYRGLKHTFATLQMRQLAQSKIRIYSHRFSEIDTGMLVVADLPKLNLGQEIGTGTNITSININYDIKGITTTYKCNLFTNELGRYQKAYQDLVDKLRRDQRRLQQRLLPTKFKLHDPRPNSDSFSETFVAKIISRYDDNPYYLCQIHKEVVSNGFVSYQPAMVGGVKTTNLSETAGFAARLPIGTFVRIRPARRIKLSGNIENAIAVVEAWTMEESPKTPESLKGRIVANLGNSGNGPTYAVELISGDTSLLLPSELAQLSTGIVNLGEPKRSVGYLPLNTEVTIDWTMNTTDKRYSPSMNQALNIFVPA